MYARACVRVRVRACVCVCVRALCMYVWLCVRVYVRVRACVTSATRTHLIQTRHDIQQGKGLRSLGRTPNIQRVAAALACLCLGQRLGLAAAWLLGEGQVVGDARQICEQILRCCCCYCVYVSVSVAVCSADQSRYTT